jgi:hypothetical protein
VLREDDLADETILEAKDQAPVAVYPHAPEPVKLTIQPVKLPARHAVNVTHACLVDYH